MSSKIQILQTTCFSYRIMFWSCHSFAYRQLCCCSACKMVAWLNYEKKADAKCIFTRLESWAHKSFVTRSPGDTTTCISSSILKWKAFALSEIHLRPRSRKILFAHNFFLKSPVVLKICTEHGCDTAMRCTRFQNGLTSDVDDLDQQDFAIFKFWKEFQMNFAILQQSTGFVCRDRHTKGLWADNWNLQIISIL